MGLPSKKSPLKAALRSSSEPRRFSLVLDEASRPRLRTPFGSWPGRSPDSGNWVVIGSDPNRRDLAFQRAGDGWAPPTWPDLATPQQMHLDIRVTDPDAAQDQLLALGATRTPAAHETGFRVFTDPHGHPFCIVFRHSPAVRMPRPQRSTPAAR